ncbi:MAG: hypothetical protein U0556_01085 [Dehalococcoidia bacterium]
MRRSLAVTLACTSAAAIIAASADPTAATIPGCPLFPSDSVWNTRIDHLPVHPRSDAYVGSIGAATGLKADFGSGLWEGGPIGIPFVNVPDSQGKVNVAFEYDDESDPGPYPIPPNPPIEGGPASDGDRHILMVDQDACRLYELYSAYPNDDGSWRAGSGAIFDLRGHTLRPETWTSADAAGLAILPGLVRFEDAAGLRHAVRFTARRTQRAYVWPARHFASSIVDPNVPPMGQRFRLKASYDVSRFSPQVRTILTGLKQYGLILADNGSDWYLSGEPDERWDNDLLRQLGQVPGSAFEAVDGTALMIDRGSGRARQPGPFPYWFWLPLGSK